MSRQQRTESITTNKLMDLLDDQQHRCALSGRKLTPETAALDHIVPIKQGGRNDLSNVHFVHQDVNNAKGQLCIGDFVALCKDVANQAQQVKEPWEALKSSVQRCTWIHTPRPHL